MRRKITQIEQLADDLPDLTSQQMEFVRHILDGNTASDAYRKAYDCSASGNNTIWVEASRLRSNPNVALWLTTARAAGFGRIVRTKEERIARMESLVQIGVQSGNIGAAVQAEINAGKLEGHYKENIDLNVTDMADELRELAKISPELAKVYADKNGITWQ